MAVITKFFVVRNGVELDQVFEDKKAAEAYDKLLDAAQSLAELIGQADLQIDIDSRKIEDITVYMAQNAPAVIKILKGVKPLEPESKTAGESKPQTVSEQVKDSARVPRATARNKA